MTLKDTTRTALAQAAGLYESGQCRFTTKYLWRPAGNSIPEKPEAACILGAIYHAVGATDAIEAPAISAATAAIATAGAIRHGIEGGRSNIVTINDEVIPRIRTGPGLTFPDAEALTARILKDAAELVSQVPGEFENTDQGAAELVQALDLLERRILEIQGPAIVHDGFHPPPDQQEQTKPWDTTPYGH